MKRVLIVLAVVALLPVAAQATPVYFAGTGYGATVTTSLNGSINRTGYGGELLLSWNSNKTDPFVGYCLTLSHVLTNLENVDIRDLSELPDQSPLNPPYADDQSGGKVAWLLNRYAPGVQSPIAGGALQVAIWEVLYDTAGGYNLAAGDFQASSGVAGVISTAQTYLSALGSHTSDATWLDSYAINPTDGARTQAGQDYGVPVPEPASMLLLGSGLIGLAGAVRRRARK